MTPELIHDHPILVRAAQPDEYDAVGLLVAQAYRDGGEIDGSDAYAAVLQDVRGRAGTSEVLVAVRDGRLVGSVTVIPAGAPASEFAHDGELEFRFLAVTRADWGTGVADRLVDAVVATARRRGLDTVMGLRDGNDAAQRLYARHGFARLPERDLTPAPGVELLGMVRRTAVR